MLTDTRAVVEVGPTEPMTDAELEAMVADAEARGLVPTPRAALRRLLDELRDLPEGLATRVRADLLIADLLGRSVPRRVDGCGAGSDSRPRPGRPLESRKNAPRGGSQPACRPRGARV